MTRRQLGVRRGHEYVRGHLSSYMDGQLAARERARVETHLQTCQSCREELRTLEWTKSLLQQVPTVPVPRSFVIREADLAPRQIARRRPAVAGPRAAALQWATALVAILLVVVVAGDVFLGARLAAPRGQPEIAMLSEKPPTVVVTVVVESETVVEAPKAQAATEEESQVESPEEAPRMLVAPTPAGKTVENGEASRPVEIMGGGGTITETATDLPLRVEGAPEKATPGTTPRALMVPQGTPAAMLAEPSQEQQVPDVTDTAPIEDKQDQTEAAETPLAMAPPIAAEREDTPGAPSGAEPGERDVESALPLVLARVGWRVAEIGLGILMAGLIIALIWRRYRR